MTQGIDDKARDVIFQEARSHTAWLDRPVTDETLRQVYDLMKWGPTSANSAPARIVFLRTLFPHAPAMRGLFETNPDLVTATARRNSSLQGAYFVIAARAVGLDCGPMSGFDQAKVDEEFFGRGRECEGCDQEYFPEGHVRTNFLCNVGYGDRSKLFPRGPRLAFEEACSLL